MQKVGIDGSISNPFDLCCEVPQESCLGPILFIIYASKLFKIIEHELPSAHCYDDDTQLYLSFKLIVHLKTKSCKQWRSVLKRSGSG